MCVVAVVAQQPGTPAAFARPAAAAVFCVVVCVCLKICHPKIGLNESVHNAHCPCTPLETVSASLLPSSSFSLPVPCLFFSHIHLFFFPQNSLWLSPYNKPHRQRHRRAVCARHDSSASCLSSPSLSVSVSLPPAFLRGQQQQNDKARSGKKLSSLSVCTTRRRRSGGGHVIRSLLFSALAVGPVQDMYVKLGSRLSLVLAWCGRACLRVCRHGLGLHGGKRTRTRQQRRREVENRRARAMVGARSSKATAQRHAPPSPHTHRRVHHLACAP